jgi:hypothetical protein
MNRIYGFALVSSLALVAVGRGAVHAQPLPSGAMYADFNGDGFADLAIGAPGDHVGSLAGAGAVNLLRGSAGGLTVVGDERYHQDSLSVPDVAEAGDSFGQALAVGDFNGDGVADLAVGVPDEGVGAGASAQAGAGAVNIFHGWAGGYQLFVGYQLWNQDIAGVPGMSETGDAFGTALASGDFDCDLRSDLAVGVPLEDVGGVSGAGAVNVFYSGGAALGTSRAQLWHQDSPGIANAPQTDDQFGSALASGDFNGDGCDDLAIGVPREDPFGLVTDWHGAVHVLHGGPNGLTATASQLWKRQGGGGLDLFGWSLAAGDYDGDGIDDLAIGSPGASGGGSVSVYYGSAAGLTAFGSDPLNQGIPGMPGIIELGDNFGRSLAAADYDGDGFTDLAIGVALEEVAGVPSAGAVNVNYGSPDGLRSGRYQLWHQDSAGVQDVPDDGDQFGRSLGAGDFNGDGFWDLAIGVPYEDVFAEGGAMQADGGAVEILYGSAAGLGFDVRVDQLWTQSLAGVEGDVSADDTFGLGLAAR